MCIYDIDTQMTYMCIYLSVYLYYMCIHIYEYIYICLFTFVLIGTKHFQIIIIQNNNIHYIIITWKTGNRNK